MNAIGLYLHVPFCRSKCPYCDFYSKRSTEAEMDAYCEVLCRNIMKSCKALQMDSECKADTLYIGGGTPSVLGAERLKSLIMGAKQGFLTEDAEITVECNPHKLPSFFFEVLRAAGVNRISLGLQSAVETERRMLGRLSSRAEVESVVRSAQSAGIQNISLDVMLGIPNQTENSLAETLDFCLSLGVPHISAYILKLEENTVFYKRRTRYDFPDDDRTADLYLQMCEALESGGLRQYEISNFAKTGFESRHNLKYWHCEEYLGLGPAAHSYINGKRFYFPRDLQAFLKGEPPVEDGIGGDFTEYAMLALRLREGLRETTVQARFGHGIPKEMRKKAESLATHGLLENDCAGIRLTRQGFLLSNSILAEIL